MLERETESIIGTIGERVIGKAPSVAVKDLLASDVPVCIKTFFRADVEALLLGELRSHQKESRFPFDLPDVQRLQAQMNTHLVLNYTLGREEFLTRLNDTVHLMVNYLIRPQWTLTGVLFEHDEAISRATLARLLRYFGPYEYFREVLIAYVEEKKLPQITRGEFSTLVWKADSGFIRRKTGLELAKILSPLYDFFDYPGKSGRCALPIRALIRHFEDKGLTSALSQLEGEAAQGRTSVTQAELGEILEAARRAYGAFETSHRTMGEFDREQRTEPIPPSRRIELAIPEEESRKFIRKLFAQDDNAFRKALGTLGAIQTWKDASRAIDELFIEHSVDPYSSEAKRFIEVIFHQYHPPS
jgi:hypothetical protein